MTIRKLYMDKKRNRMTVRNQNVIQSFVGATGSGKSYGALTYCDEIMYGKFNANKHLIFKLGEFMELVNSKKLKRGDMVLFEEAGVNISSKNWSTKANQNINFVLQTCRHLNFGVIFTLPMLKFLDNSSRSLLHGVFVTDEIDYKNNISKFKVYDFKQHPLKSEEPYLIIPRFYIDKSLTKMRRIHFKLPRQELIDIYEKRKIDYTAELNKRVQEQIETEEREVNRRIKKSVGCPSCGNSAFTRYKKDSSWECRTCGYKTYENPYGKVNGRTTK